MEIRKTEFNVTHSDGTEETIVLDVEGQEYWSWFTWYNEQENALVRYLQSRGHTKLPKSAAWNAGV